MKKLIFVLTSVILFTSLTNSFAQEALKQGSYNLAGSISFSSGTNESTFGKSESISVFVAPSLMYFFMDDFSFGLNFSFGYFESTWKSTNQESKYIYRPISVGPIIRYYLSGGTFIPFLEASYQYSNILTGNADANSLSVGGGINYFLTKSAALEPFIAYRRSTYISGDQKTSSISFGLRVNYFIIE